MTGDKLNNKRRTRASISPFGRLFAIVSGLFLIFFIGVHLYFAHINSGHPIQSYASVIENLHNPWWFAFFIVFVWAISYHAANGIGQIIKDLNLSEKGKGYVDIAMLVLFIVTAIYGTILAALVAKLSVP